ncbi:MAG: hypothetical protein U0992_02005 [Planctomycetaceae bacterium]
MESFPPGYDLGPATWFYLSLVLIIAVFFRFNRFWSLRNFDLGLLLAAPVGLLLVQVPGRAGIGFSWLFAVSGLFLVRLLADPLLVRRPHLGQNLNAPGSAFLCVAAFALLTMEAINGETTAATEQTVQQATNLVKGKEDIVQEEQHIAAGPVAPMLWAPIGAPFKAPEIAARALSIIAHLLVILGLLLVGRNLFGDVQLGLAMATLYLLLPCTAYDVGEVNHVLPSALTVWALVAYRRPMVSGTLLGLACGIMFFPVFLLPVWAAFYGRRGALRFGTALLLVAGVVLSIAALTAPGPDSFVRRTIGTIHLEEMLAFEAPVGTLGFWSSELRYYRIPVIVTFFVLLATLTFWPRRKSLEHLTASSAAIVVATQFWYPDQGGVYLLWYLPLLLVVVFRPRLVHLVPHSSPEEGEQTARAPAISGPHTQRSQAYAERTHLFR